MPTRLIKAAIVVAGLAIWFWTQGLIGSKTPPPDPRAIGDSVHDWTAGWNAALHANMGLAHALLIVSSLCIDALGLFIIFRSVFGPSVRPFFGLILLFSLRQICQLTTTLPLPDDKIWEHPGFPSLLVTYGVSNDLFFSGHTAMAVYGCLELFRLGSPLWRALGIVVALFEIVVVLVLRAHWTMDVFAGAVTALWIGGIAGHVAAPLDRWLGKTSSAVD